jgi:hypothetical protein
MKKNQSDETLTGKGFQRTMKKIFFLLRKYFFANYIDTFKSDEKSLVLIHNAKKNVNKIVWKIFLVRGNYF